MARPSEKRGFRYNQRSKEDLRERANMKGGDFDTIIKPKYKVYKPHDGKNVVRVLPPTWDGAKHYGFDVFVNYNIGVDNQSYLSLSKMKGEADPLAEARREAERAGDKDLAKALAPRMRIGMWVIDRMNEDEGPLLWLAPFTLDKAIANLSFDEDTKEVVFIDDPENGCDVRFYKEGTGLKTDYDASKIRILKPSPLHEDEGIQAEWLEYVQENPIPDCLQYYDYDHISAAFDGTVANKDKDADEEKPRGRKAAAATDDDDDAPPPRRRAAPVDDDDDTPPVRGRSRVTEPVDDDDAEAEAPPPRRRAAAADDDDDAPPARSSIRDRLQTRRSRIEAED